MKTAPARLGELLEQRGQITREQLLRALRNQKVLGGRLGTCLLEIEALSEENLCSALAEQQGLPCASPEDLRGIPDDVLELLPAKVAKRCHAIAFHASSTQVKVALIEARNLAFQDEISFVVGKRIRWHVAPELRMVEALEKHYGEECPSRLAKLLDKMNRSRFLWAKESGAPAGGPRPTRDQLQWDSQIAGVPPAAGGSEAAPENPSSISLELPQFQHQALDLPIPALPDAPALAFRAAKGSPAAPSSAGAKAAGTAPAPAKAAPRAAAAPAPTPPTAPAPATPSSAAPRGARASVKGTSAPAPSPAPAPPSAPPRAVAPAAQGAASAPTGEPAKRTSVAESEQRLLQARERDDVARALLDFAAAVAPRAVLFVVRKQEAAAWFWEGAGYEPVHLGALRIDLKQPSFFDSLKEKGAVFRGALPKLPAHSRLAVCFTTPALAPEVLVLPVKVKERLVAALLLEPGLEAGRELAAADLADLQRVIAKAEIAFELCIMQAKLRKA